MAADAVLWLILAAAVAFISCGCRLTARPKPVGGFGAAKFDREFDRAA